MDFVSGPETWFDAVTSISTVLWNGFEIKQLHCPVVAVSGPALQHGIPF